MEFSLSAFEEVADRVYRVVAEPEAVNVGLVVGSTGALVVDTGSSPAQGRAIRAAAEAVAGDVPLVAVVITHSHFDHLFGLAGFAGVASYGHAGLADELAADADVDATLARLGLSLDDVVLPDRTFTLATTVNLGDCRAEVVHFGRGHTSTDAAVIVPERDVVFAGDLLESSSKPSVGPDSSLRQWALTLDGTLGALRASTVIVPGHGEPVDRTFAFMQRAELHYLYAQAEQLYGRGVRVEDAWAAVADWPWPEADVVRVLTVVYGQLRAAGRKPARTLPLA